MLRTSQRIAVLGLAATAVALHLSLCRYMGWQYGALPIFDYFPAHQVRPPGDASRGLMSAIGESVLVGAVGGVAIPIALLATAGFLWRHWREQVLIRRGACRDCFHQTSGAERCPECGSRQVPTR